MRTDARFQQGQPFDADRPESGFPVLPTAAPLREHPEVEAAQLPVSPAAFSILQPGVRPAIGREIIWPRQSMGDEHVATPPAPPLAPVQGMPTERLPREASAAAEAAPVRTGDTAPAPQRSGGERFAVSAAAPPVQAASTALVATPTQAVEAVEAPAAEAVRVVLGSEGATWLRELRPRYAALRAQRAQNVPVEQQARAALRQLLQQENESAAQAIRQGLSTVLSAAQLPSEAAIERVLATRPRHGHRLASEQGMTELLQQLMRPASLIAEVLAACNQDRRQAYQDLIPETFLPLAVAYLAGWGVLESLRAPGVTDVMIGARATEVRRNGRIEAVGPGWDGEAIAVYVEQMGGPKPTPTQPFVDWRLPDGSRGNATDATTGEGTLCLRQHPEISKTVQDLLANGTLTEQTHRFLQAAMAARLNLLIAGGTGSGKTTLLKICLDAETLPPGKRGIIIEQEDFELPAPTGLKSVVRWHSGRPTPDRPEALTMRQLVTNALRARPDLIIIGECRGGEVLAALEAANTGHEGTLTTLHANSAADAVPRLVTLGMSANPQLTEAHLQRWIASVFQMVLFLQRDEARDAYVLQEISQLASSAEPGQTYTTTPLFQSIQVEGRWVCQRTHALLDQRLAARFAAKGVSLDWLEGGRYAN